MLAACLVIAIQPSTPAENPAWQWKLQKEVKVGDGPAVALGDAVTIDFIATNEAGREVANTRKRGLTLTLRASDSGDVLAQALVGMRETGEREVLAMIDSPGVPPIVSSGEALRVWIKIVRLSNPGRAAAQTAPAKKVPPSPR